MPLYRPSTGGTGSLKYAANVPGSGTGSVTITHNLNTTDIGSVSVQRIAVPGGTTHPLGHVIVHWKIADSNSISLDFDTYARAASEFHVTVTA